MSTQKIYNVISVAVVAILLFLLLRQCSGGNSGGDPSVVTRDTVTDIRVVVSTQIDTFYQYITQQLPPQPVPSPVYIDRMDSTVASYVDSTCDSNVVLRYSARVRGQLLNITHDYTIKQPNILERRDSTITIDRTVTVTKYKWGIYFGGGADFSVKDFKAHNQPFGAFLAAAVTTNHGGLYGYSYDLIDNAHRVTVMYRLYPFPTRKSGK